MVLWGWFAGSAGTAAACDGTRPVAEVAATLAEADRALVQLDAAAFGEATSRAADLVPCLGEPIPSPVAAALHRAMGLRAFGGRDPLAPAAFAAARRLEPGAVYPSPAVPEASPVNEAWRAVTQETLTVVTLPTPADGWVALDGVRTLQRVAELPVVFQQVATDGRTVTSAYLLPGEAPPPYPVAPVVPAIPAPPLVLGSAPTHPARKSLAWVTAGTGVGAAALWGLAAHGHARYVDLDDPVPDARLDGLRTRTNALAVGSFTSGVACTVSGVLLAATW
jgi:hypothetical protein